METVTKNLQRQSSGTPQAAQGDDAGRRQDIPRQAATPLVPPVDIVEAADGITLVADMPGVSRENLSIDVDGDTLVIDGKVDLHESTRLQNVYAEIRVAEYRRSFVLSRDLDTDRIDAKLQNGVVTLHIAKREQAKPKRIEIKSW